MSPDKLNTRYALLDFSRLFAAILVVGFHISSGKNELLNLGYLAVDYFFVLSGYVLAPQIERVTDRSRLITFAKQRYRRLIPNTALSLLLVAIIALSIWSFGSQSAMVWNNFNVVSVLSYITFTSVFVTSSIALNYPIWSLSTEFIINCCSALIRIGLKRPIQVILFFASIPVSYFTIVNYFNLDLAPLWVEPLLRTASGFAVGYLSRLFVATKQSKILNTTIFLTAIFLLLSGNLSLGVQCLGATLLSLVFRSQTKWTSPKIAYAGVISGELSFLVYLLHVPLLGVIDIVEKKTHLFTAPELYVQVPLRVSLILIICLLVMMLRAMAPRRSGKQ